MDAYRQLTSARTSTRTASRLTGIARATADRDAVRPTPLLPQRQRPANALSVQEKAQVLAALTAPSRRRRSRAGLRGVAGPGVYVGSISTMYRVLREDAQVVERRRQARHPAIAPELVATGPGRS